MEILETGRSSDRPTLLFIHGSFCAAWIWAEHFLPYFAARGWHCRALSLRGHGASPGTLDGLGVADFVADIAEAARGLDRPPILIGHSLGGILAQHYACHHRITGMILLGSVGVGGLGASLAHMGLWHPDLLAEITKVQMFGPRAADFDTIRRGLLSPDFPRDLASRYVPRFQRESKRAAWELLPPQAPWLAFHPPVPTLSVLGSEDAFIPWPDFALTAALWQAETAHLPDVPHVMMLDTTWRLVAERMADWLNRQVGGGQPFR